ncbi:hypothetical protein KKE92_04745 [Candidatus Micrarchaeota archaeon]|nr:hypothetical protein [Candidatus Micrarchaeota archaeon]
MRKAFDRPSPRSEIAVGTNVKKAFQRAKVLKEDGKIRLFGIATKIIESILTHGFYRKEGHDPGFYKAEITPEASFRFILFIATKLEEGKLADTVNSDLTIEAVLHEAKGLGLVQLSRDFHKDWIQRTKRVAKAQNIIVTTLSSGFTMEKNGKAKHYYFEIKEGCWDRLLKLVVSKIKKGMFSGVYDYHDDLPQTLREAEKHGLIEIKQTRNF